MHVNLVGVSEDDGLRQRDDLKISNLEKSHSKTEAAAYINFGIDSVVRCSSLINLLSLKNYVDFLAG